MSSFFCTNHVCLDNVRTTHATNKKCEIIFVIFPNNSESNEITNTFDCRLCEMSLSFSTITKREFRCSCTRLQLHAHTFHTNCQSGMRNVCENILAWFRARLTNWRDSRRFRLFLFTFFRQKKKPGKNEKRIHLDGGELHNLAENHRKRRNSEKWISQSNERRPTAMHCQKDGNVKKWCGNLVCQRAK